MDDRNNSLGRGRGAASSAERYGQTRVAKIRAAFNDLRSAVRSGDIVAANDAMDRYEQWADYVLAPQKKWPQ